MQPEIISENEGFIRLPENVDANSFKYVLVERVDDVVIYEQFSEGRRIAYEVFEIRRMNAQILNGHSYPAKEKFPAASEWGNNAFTVYTIEKAKEKMVLILNNIQKRLSV